MSLGLGPVAVVRRNFCRLLILLSPIDHVISWFRLYVFVDFDKGFDRFSPILYLFDISNLQTKRARNASEHQAERATGNLDHRASVLRWMSLEHLR